MPHLLVLVVLLAAGRQASADTQKSPTIATGLAIGGTAASIAIGAIAEESSGSVRTTGLVIGYCGLMATPSLGHLYAGETGHAIRWTSLRAVSLAAAVSGLYLVINGRDGAPFGAGLTLTALGSSGYLLGATWDLTDAHRAAIRSNRHRTEMQTARIGLVPLLRANAAGISLAGSF